MISIYQRALGSEFSKLHPRIQDRFSIHSESGYAFRGTGVMESLWHGPIYTLPFLYVGTWRSIMFPEKGAQVPFTIENYAYVDSLGRETVTWVRTFQATRKRRFDAYMIWSDQRGCIVDYLGTHQHLAVDLEMRVAGNGGIQIHSTEQRFFEGPVAFRFPMFFPEPQMCASGSMKHRSASAFALASQIPDGESCSGIAAAFNVRE